MKKEPYFIGIDVSKDKLDVRIHHLNHHFIIENRASGFSSLLETCCTMLKCKKDELFICFENTGRYSRLLSVFLDDNNVPFLMEVALRIKRSLGITRGKDDKIDAYRICKYLYEKRDSIQPTKLPGEHIDKIKSLLSLRDRLIRNRTSFKNALTDLYDAYSDDEHDVEKEIQLALIEKLDDGINQVEEEILLLIESNHAFNKNYKLIRSVPGVGMISAFYLIAITHNFTVFMNARSFACYAGIAPFHSSSGNHHGKPKVNQLANHKIKTILNMAALAAIKCDKELMIYYNKRVNEDKKSKMSTINIIRNKIVHRVFAVVKRETQYVDIFKFCA